MVISCGEIIDSSPIFNEANASVGMVAKSMAENNLNGMPIVENVGNMRLVGFVDDRDIVKLVAFGRDARKTPAYEIMTPDPVTCSVKDELSFALEIMDKCHLQRLAVVNPEKKLLGILEHSEVLRHLQDEIQSSSSKQAAPENQPNELRDPSTFLEVDAM